ncbi:unnamed protein product, partial [Iphiclides podalirius]
MFGIRTPAKKPQKDMERSSPVYSEAPGTSTSSREMKTQNVRRSIGEWEADKTTKAKQSATTSANLKCNIPIQGGKRRLSIDEAHKTPEVAKEQQPDRVAEAKACLNKAKLHLSNSRNLRTDIKSE